jgi:acyl homoserine lactone synthase
MRIVPIKNLNSQAERSLSHELKRLSARILRGRLEWRVPCIPGLEMDCLAELSPTQIRCTDTAYAVSEYAGVLPALSGMILEMVFAQLLWAKSLQTNPKMIEINRFCVNTSTVTKHGRAGLHSKTLAKLAGVVEWRILKGHTEIGTATDVRLERIFRRACSAHLPRSTRRRASPACSPQIG